MIERNAFFDVKKMGLYILLTAMLILMPYVLNEYLLSICIMTFFWIILTVSLNLVGSMDYICVCHATFYGVGGYISAILTQKAGANFILSLAAGSLGAGIVAVIIAFPVFRVRGHYFAIATLAFGLIMSLVFSNWYAVTGGDRGIIGVFSPIMDPRMYYYLVLVVVVAVVIFSAVIFNSRLGRQLVAIREDEDLAQQMGINTMKCKILMFTLEALIAGLAGGLMVHFVNFVHYKFFSFAYSFQVIMGMIMGGIGTTGGAVLGGIIAVGLPELLRFTFGWRFIVVGVILIIVMILMPKGIYGTVIGWLNERKRIKHGSGS